MRSLTTFSSLLSAAAALVVVRSNLCLNNEDVYFPDPEGDLKLRRLNLCRVDCSWFYECVDGHVVGHMKSPNALQWASLEPGLSHL